MKIFLNHIYVSLLLFFLFTQQSSSKSISKISNIHIFSAQKIFTERFLLENISLRPNKLFSKTLLDQDLSKISSLYFSECYYNVNVNLDSLIYTNDSSAVEIFVSITNGNQSLVGGFEISGNTEFTKDEILEWFDLKVELCFNPTQLETDVENLILKYENNGYPFVSIKIGTLSYADTTDSKLIVRIEIDEGPRVAIGQIEVEGNTSTKTNVIVREMRVQPGEIYNDEKVKKIPQLLKRTNIFSSVGEPFLYLLPDTTLTLENNVSSNYQLQHVPGKVKKPPELGGLLIKVIEGNTNTFDGVIGYLPGSAGKKGYVTGLVDVGMRNLFGTGRKLNVRWLREDKNSQEIGIKYLEPWLFDYPLNITGSFFQRQQDTTYIKRVVELKADLLVSGNLTVGTMFSQEQIIPSSEIVNQYILSSGTTSGGVEIHYDTRDEVYNPTRGINYRSDYYIGRKKMYSLKTRLISQRIGLDIELYYKIFQKQVAMLGVHGRELRSDNIEVSDLFRFGGTNTMRGYRENQFYGSKIMWSNLEYRFLMASRSFFFGFFDFGYYFHPAISKLNFGLSSENIKYGYGIGMRIETSLGIIGVSIALGKGDDFSQAKLHFRLINDF
jgi:outer membrane protein insertion porin family